MKFCQICGRPLNEGEICSCQQQQYSAPQQQYAAPQQQYAAPQQQYAAPQQPYAPQQPTPQRPAGDSKIVKALKNIPVAFKSYFKNSEKVIGTAKAKKDIILPAMYAAIFFLTNLILAICFFTRSKTLDYYKGLGVLKGVFGGASDHLNFGLALLGALIITVFVCVLYVGVRMVAQAVFARKPAGQAMIESFIEFGFHLIPVSCLVLVSALLGLATAWLIAPFLGLAAAYLVVSAVTATLKEAEGYQNKLVLTIFLTVAVMLTVALAFWMLFVVSCMTHDATIYGYFG